MQQTRVACRVTLLVSLFLSPFALGASEPALTLVADGQPRAVIVLADAPSKAAKDGADILKDHLLQISGAEVKVVREKDLPGAKVEQGRIVVAGLPQAEAYILVGKGQLAEKLGVTAKGLGAGGIAIETVGNALILLGPDTDTPLDPWGTRYAVTTFLEDYLGVRYLWPGELGKVVPQQKTIAIPAIHVAKTPVLRERHLRSSGYNSRSQVGLERLNFTKEDFNKQAVARGATKSASGNWFGWQRTGGLIGPMGGDGSILDKEAWARFPKEHPEWFAMQADGSRVPAQAKRYRLCESNPDLIEAIAQEKIKQLKAKPGLTMVSLIEDDGGKAGFCLCPACKALDPKEGRPTKIWTYDHKSGQMKQIDYVSLSDRMAWFYNQIAERVAKEYPNVLFTAHAYSIYVAPPVKIKKLHPNILILYVGKLRGATEEAQKQGLADWDAWAQVASHLFFRPNIGGRKTALPVIYVHRMGETLRHFAQHGMIGADIDSCMNNWATLGLDYYVMVKLLWDPDQNVDAIVDDYCRSGFGPAADEIKGYFAKLEQITNKIGEDDADPADGFTAEAIADLRGMLDAADKKAAGAPEALQRVAFLRVGLDWTEVQSQAYAILKKAQAREKVDKVQAKAVLDRKFQMMRKIFTEDFTAINVAYCCSAEWDKFNVLHVTPTGAGKAAPKKTVEADEQGRPTETPAR